ncbi:DUF5668 domain-containing protein [Clostridium sediminicola]|uniref:LiaF transmembrane domain-containing protein n=1 Tax=Clostridium sediminicola TaxID=3114879 RepID=UPI0031F259F3
MKGKIFFGIILILVGLGILLEQFGLWDFWNIIWMWWPVILIVIGAWQLATNPVSKTSGLILLLVGIFFQLRKLDVINVSLIKFFWTVLIIVIGMSFIFSANGVNKSSKYHGRDISEDVIDKFVMFSGFNARNYSTSFRGGSLVAAFGGMDIDLTDANISTEGARLDVTVAFGGIDIIVPDNWKVIVKGVPIFGGWSNKTKANNYSAVEGPVLLLKCFVAFGGIEVKTYKSRENDMA